MSIKSVFLSEITNRELEIFLEEHYTVIIPVGATEQHGPHSPVSTDVLIPQEIARRVAEQRGDLLVAPALPYTLSYPHRGFACEFSLSIETFMATIKDLALSFAKSGFKRIIFLNGHYDNTYAIAYACAQAAEQLPDEVKAIPFNYWDGIPPANWAEATSNGNDLHAGRTEASMIMAIRPELIDKAFLNKEIPNFPETKTNSPALHTAFFFSAPKSVYAITKSGTWGDATKATPDHGEKVLQWGVESVLNLLEDIEKTYRELPIR